MATHNGQTHLQCPQAVGFAPQPPVLLQWWLGGRGTRMQTEADGLMNTVSLAQTGDTCTGHQSDMQAAPTSHQSYKDMQTDTNTDHHGWTAAAPGR